MIPLKKGNSKSEYRKILTLFDQILTAKPVNREFLIRQFVHLARIHYYKSYSSFNITSPDNADWALGSSMLQSVVLLKYLENLKLLEGGRGMETDQLILPNDIKEYIQLLKYDESQTALFLLGYLVGQVGTAQTSKEFGVKSKAILNKLNFHGMSNLKVQRLVSEIFEKLKQYKVLKYNEKIFSDMKRLFDANLSNWRLSAHDNIYYILSGYSYQERRLYLNARKNEGSQQL
jgi:CRISPR-associated protein Csh1